MEEKKIYRFEEMIDAMQASLDNIKEIKEQQRKLVTIIENSDEAEDFAEFIEETNKQIEKFEDQYERLSYKRACLESVVKDMKKDKGIEKTIDELVNALGIFE